MLKISGDIDAVILKYIEDPSVDIKTLVGLIAHRLGALISKIDRKKEIWDLCVKVIKGQNSVL
jgi:hypothetical protein